MYRVEAIDPKSGAPVYSDTYLHRDKAEERANEWIAAGFGYRLWHEIRAEHAGLAEIAK